jgi:hypothetical protein
MGLDMYLTKKTSVKNYAWDAKEKKKFKVTIRKGGEDIPHIKKERITAIEEDIMYWRKANAIHDWFVKNCQEGNDDCRTAYVSEEQIKELLELLKQVIQNKHNLELVAELLPTTQGFFFGGTDYDDYYFDVIENTIKVLQEEIDAMSDETYFDYYYHSSW